MEPRFLTDIEAISYGFSLGFISYMIFDFLYWKIKKLKFFINVLKKKKVKVNVC